MAALRTRPLAPRRRVRSRSTNTAARDVGAPWPEPLPLWTWVFGDRAVTMAQTISPVHRGDGRRDDLTGALTRQRDRRGIRSLCTDSTGSEGGVLFLWSLESIVNDRPRS